MSVHETRQFLNFVFGTGNPDQHLIELRALCADGCWRHGLFTDWAAMARIANALQEEHGTRNLYYTLNPVKPEVVTYPKGLNKFTPLHKYCRCVGNHHIACRQLYLIDIDSQHPKDVMATTEEHNAVWPVADRILAYLRGRGWPEPVIVDSGNGCHLLFRGDRCAATSQFWAYCIDSFSKEFSTPEAKIDPTIHNAGRISRLPGLMNRKGQDTPERPHRKAYVVSYPTQWAALPASEVLRLAVDKGCDANVKVKRSSSSRIADEDMQELFDEFSDVLELVSTRRKGTETYYDIVCPFNGPHSGDAGKTSIIMGPDGFGFKCMSDDCEGIDRKDLMNLLRESGDGVDPWEVLYGVKERHYAKWSTSTEEMWADEQAHMKKALATAEAASAAGSKEPAVETDPMWMTGPVRTPRAAVVPPVAIDPGFAADREEEWKEFYKMREELLKKTPEWQFDAETWDLVFRTDWSQVPTDPAAWGVPKTDVLQAWLDRFVTDDSKKFMTDTRLLAADLGPEMMFILARTRMRSEFEEPPERPLTVAEFEKMAN
jgi:hypothetical protein